ncbi:uncharacterized protein LOC120112226 [Phoenix dactylifera]|uniref:Uncharacterized protein LOC120112226 n=1 Tax=Phoenix dactylifera TaxID=42345 RepID=A0A8B9AKZ3_PHODC|nr:uncharacterized protein LOC120112226 [Phoenix dactylifera]
MADSNSNTNSVSSGVTTSSDSAYVLHPSDNPGISLVTQSLTGDNYATWCRAMHMALMAKNKFGFVDGTIRKPDSSDAKASQWEQCNRMVYSWILNSMHHDIANSVMYAEKASKVWSELNDQMVMQFLMGLNESYNAICSQILLMDLLPTVSRAYSLLLQDE